MGLWEVLDCMQVGGERARAEVCDANCCTRCMDTAPSSSHVAAYLQDKRGTVARQQVSEQGNCGSVDCLHSPPIKAEAHRRG